MIKNWFTELYHINSTPKELIKDAQIFFQVNKIAFGNAWLNSRLHSFTSFSVQFTVYFYRSYLLHFTPHYLHCFFTVVIITSCNHRLSVTSIVFLLPFALMKTYCRLSWLQHRCCFQNVSTVQQTLLKSILKNVFHCVEFSK